MPSPRQIVLKDGYYLDHFREMLEFVRARYEHVFEPCHIEFLQDFSKLPQEAQFLYVRMANRKGTIFQTDWLRYEEIPNVARAADLLSKAGFARDLEPHDFRELLRLTRREDLVALLRQ